MIPISNTYTAVKNTEFKYTISYIQIQVQVEVQHLQTQNHFPHKLPQTNTADIIQNTAHRIHNQLLHDILIDSHSFEDVFHAEVIGLHD